MGDVERLEEARNDAGYLGCRIGDVGCFEDKEIQNLIDKASVHYEEMLECLKEALYLARKKGIE